MRIYYPNLIDSYSAITGTSRASTTLSYENIAHAHKSKVWRTGTSVADEYVTIDLGSAQAATACIIFAHTLLGTDSTIQLRKSTDNFAANDVLVGNFTWNSSAMLLTFSSASSRYWRLVFTKSSAGSSRDIGRVFLGNYVDFTGLPDFDGFQCKPVDLSQSQRMQGGQVYSSIGAQYRSVSLDMSGVTQAQVEALKLHGETVGTHTPFFLTADVGANGEAGEIFYCKLTKMANRDADGMSGADLAWAAPTEVEECL